MAEEPTRLVTQSKGPLDLRGGNALLRAAHHVDRHEPLGHGDMGVLEDGPDLDRVLLAAHPALAEPRTGGLAFNASLALGSLTVRAYRPVRPDQALDEGNGLVLIGEVWG